jgi:hypothetical protein
MTSTQLPRPTPAPEVPPPPPPPLAAPLPGRPSRALPITIGTVLATIGTVVTLAGSGILALAGNDGTVGSGTHSFSTTTSALVSSAADIDSTSDAASLIGQPKIGLSATAKQDGRDVFVGIGPKDAVDRYLDGAAVDKATDFDVAPFKMTTERHEGSATPAPPASQSFWVAQSSGHTAELDWDVHDGDYRLVVMNADGSPDVSTDGHVEAGADHLSTVALAALIAGIVALAGGIAVMVPKGGRV